MYWEINFPDGIKDLYIDITNIDFEEVITAFNVIVNHLILHVQLEHLVLIGDIHHENRDVEPFLQVIIIHKLYFHFDFIFFKFWHFGK
jgi:hypothetical protein